MAVTCRRAVITRKRTDRDVFLGCDATQDANESSPGGKVYIAVGCDTGCVFVYDGIGLMLFKVTMDAPVVTLDWLEETSTPPVFPRRKDSLSAFSGNEEEGERAVPVNVFTHYECSASEAEEESGTVKRTSFSSERPGARNFIRFDGGRDLFSPGPESSSLNRRKSEIFFRSPAEHEAALEPVRRSFLRPRIATETFKDPYNSSSPRRSGLKAPTSSTAGAVHEALRTTDSRQLFDVFFSDPLRASPTRSPSPPASVCSTSTGSETWMTPPTTQKLNSGDPIDRCRISSSPRPAKLPRSVLKSLDLSPASPTGSTSLSSVVPPKQSLPPFRKVSFVDEIVDQKVDRRKVSLAERSPFPAPPGQHEKRDASFEIRSNIRENEIEENSTTRKRSWTQDEIGRLEKPKRERSQRAFRRSQDRSFAASALELRKEHQILRQEISLMREELRALRRTLMDLRR